ncbi:MAG: lectin like domain-containing protein [Vicinamibacterales bacterium]
MALEAATGEGVPARHAARRSTPKQRHRVRHVLAGGVAAKLAGSYRASFLIKNSWGTSFGQSGYFWISYYDSQVATANAMFYAPEPTNNYDNFYQHDPLGWVSSLGYTSGDKTMAWFANVFTATGSQDVRAVSFFVGSANSPYTVYVFVDLADGDPTSGTLGATKTGAIASEGYHTVVLDAPVPVSAGQKFSAVVHLTTPGWDFPIPVEYFQTGYSSGATASAGESFFSHDNSTWADATT